MERPLRSPMTSDLRSQKTEAPVLPVMVLPEPMFPMEIHWIWIPSPELLETVTPIKEVRLAPCRREMPALLLPVMVPARRSSVELAAAEIPPQA